MLRGTSLMHQLQAYCHEHLLEGDQLVLLAKYHMTHRGIAGYVEMLNKSFQEYRTEQDLDKVIELGTLLAYLLEIDPFLWPYLKKAQKNFLDFGITCLSGKINIPTAELFLKLLGKLTTQDQCYQMMGKNMSHGSNHSTSLPIHLAILLKKIEWEMEKPMHFVVDGQEEAYQLVDRVVKHLKQISHQTSDRVMEMKIQLLAGVMKYLNQQKTIKYVRSSLNFQELFNSTKENIMILVASYELFVPSDQNSFFQMVTNYLDLMQIYEEDRMKEIMRRHHESIFNPNFLEMIRNYIINSKKGTPLHKQVIQNLLNKIYDIIFESSGTRSEKYTFIKTCCDLIISISDSYAIDFTKKILKMAFNHQKTLNGLFLASLMTLYTFKLGNDATTQIQRHSHSGKGLAQEQDQYFKNYQKLLTSYAEIQLQIDQIYRNPERDDMIPMELLILRNSVKINLINISITEILGIFDKLTQYMIFSIFPEECQQILLILIDNLSLENLKIVAESVKFPPIINKLIKYHYELHFDLPTNTTLDCLWNILQSIKNKFQIEDIQNLQLLLSVTSLLSNIAIKQRRSCQQFLDISTKLYKLCLRSPKSKPPLQTIDQVLENVLQLVSKNISPIFFDLYLELMLMLRDYDLGEQSLANLTLEYKIKRKEILVSKSTSQKHDIAHFMLNRNQFDQNVCDHCWMLFKQGIHNPHNGLCLLLANTFHYLQQQFKQKRIVGSFFLSYEQFLKQQILKTSQIITLLIVQIEATSVLQLALEMFQVMSHLVVNLHRNIKEYLNKKGQAYRVEFIRIDRFAEELFKFYENKKWQMNFEGTHLHQTFKKTWETSYFMTLLLLPACTRLSFRKKSDPDSFIRNLITSFTNLRQVMDKTDQQLQIKMYSILLCETSTLEKQGGITF